MTIRVLLAVTALLLPFSAYAEDPASPQMQAQDVGPALSSSSFEIAPQVSVSNPSTFVLSHDGFTVPFSSMDGMRTLYLAIVRPVTTFDSIRLSFLGKAGYGTTSGQFGFTHGDESGTDNIRLHWIPLSAAIRAEYQVPQIVKPWIVVGAGTQWTLESAATEGLTHSFWIPYVSIGTGLTFFENDAHDWFGGFNFGVSYENSFATSQIFRAWSVDLSINILL